jgi:mRNA interferase RelE/StbE
LVRKLNRCHAVLSEEPHAHPRIKRLTGTHAGLWRFRVGDWRVVYAVDEASMHVNVMVIGHRRDVYR